MLWIVLIVLVAILGSFLWTWVKNYEKESAEAAHERIGELEERLESMTDRIEHLEAINTEPSGTVKIDSAKEAGVDAPTYRTRTRS